MQINDGNETGYKKNRNVLPYVPVLFGFSGFAVVC